MSYLKNTNHKGGILMLDRHPVNAMDLPFLRQLNKALADFAGDPPPAVVIGGLPGCFSAGVDLKAVPEYGTMEQRQMVCAINEMVLTAYALPCPVVAAITGHAIAGGLVLALCADYRIASSEGRYGLSEVRVGVPYPAAAIGVVHSELEPRAARRLALTGRLSDAAECAALGVFDEVVESREVLDRALQVACELAASPADVYAKTKTSLRREALATMHAAADGDPLMEAWLRPAVAGGIPTDASPVTWDVAKLRARAAIVNESNEPPG